MLDWNTYQTAYQAATPELKAVIDSSLISNAINTIIPSATVEQRRDLIRGVFLVLSNLLTEEQLLPIIHNDQASLSIAQLKQIVQNVRTAQSSLTGKESSEIPVPAVRTMADDAAVAQGGEQTYSSSQDALLRPNPPVPQNPNQPPQA